MANDAINEIPRLMRSLERDHRGYPVPWIVARDKDGGPVFTVNDHWKIHDCVTKKLCAICGKRLDGLWFVGGSRAFLHEAGGFLDPPVHYDCGLYALRVCPYLAARKYTDKPLTERLRVGMPPDVNFVDMYKGRTHYPGLPERFGFGLAERYSAHMDRPTSLLFTVDNWLFIEWWRAGERINAPDTGAPPP